MATIKIKEEQIEEIVKQELIDFLNIMYDNLDKVKRTQQGFMFSRDWEDDVKLIRRYIKAFKRTIEIYT